jgi:6-phosphogluconate dehydrogenase
MATQAQFGMIGLAVMGKNLALNVADHGYSVAVWNLEQDVMQKAVANTPLRPTSSLGELVGAVERPRKIMMMIKAGEPVDSVLEKLVPLLEPGDIVIEGGNSWYLDTQRREAELAAKKVHFFGVGVSGGEEGARHGPSLMPGGNREAYQQIKPILEAIAAETEAGACVTYVGPGGAGHFVKMVHNGIEYADMQCIAEAYHVLRDLLAATPNELSEIFGLWNKGPLESFLIEITAKIFSVKEESGGGYLVDKVLDQAGQKGTGRWTAQVALELGISIPSIAASIDARVLSSMKKERVRASNLLSGPRGQTVLDDRARLISNVHDALLASKICAYAQGMALIGGASAANGWGIQLEEMARIWKGGCIIRARFLESIRAAYRVDPELSNLLLDPSIAEQVAASQAAWRKVIALATQWGIPVPVMGASVAYYDAYRSPSLPQNLTQAQRDAFGAHTYERIDRPGAAPVHTDWLR